MNEYAVGDSGNIESMLIDKILLDELTEKAKASPRLRANYDLRDSADDESVTWMQDSRCLKVCRWFAALSRMSA